jgi:hypothetical protein
MKRVFSIVSFLFFRQRESVAPPPRWMKGILRRRSREQEPTIFQAGVEESSTRG